jgi:hypothetical protein
VIGSVEREPVGPQRRNQTGRVGRFQVAQSGYIARANVSSRRSNNAGIAHAQNVLEVLCVVDQTNED